MLIFCLLSRGFNSFSITLFLGGGAAAAEANKRNRVSRPPRLLLFPPRPLCSIKFWLIYIVLSRHWFGFALAHTHSRRRQPEIKHKTAAPPAVENDVKQRFSTHSRVTLFDINYRFLLGGRSLFYWINVGPLIQFDSWLDTHWADWYSLLAVAWLENDKFIWDIFTNRWGWVENIATNCGHYLIKGVLVHYK